jgi:hypothetical protein
VGFGLRGKPLCRSEMRGQGNEHGDKTRGSKHIDITLSACCSHCLHPLVRGLYLAAACWSSGPAVSTTLSTSASYGAIVRDTNAYTWSAPWRVVAWQGRDALCAGAEGRIFWSVFRAVAGCGTGNSEKYNDDEHGCGRSKHSSTRHERRITEGAVERFAPSRRPAAATAGAPAWRRASTASAAGLRAPQGPSPRAPPAPPPLPAAGRGPWPWGWPLPAPPCTRSTRAQRSRPPGRPRGTPALRCRWAAPGAAEPPAYGPEREGVQGCRWHSR